MTMLYTTTAITSNHEKYLNRKRKKKGIMPTIIITVTSEIQFFFDLKTLIRKSTSLQSCFRVGITREPFSFFQPYEGGWSRLSINVFVGIDIMDLKLLSQ